MTDAEKIILSQNINWIYNQNNSNKIILSGILNDISKFILKKYGDFPPPEDCLKLFSEIFDLAGTAFSCYDFALLCREMFSISGSDSAFFQSTSPRMSEQSFIGAVSYIKNDYYDNAYAAFSKESGSLTQRYDTDFQSACESVYYGKAKYSILPIESSSDGFLISFRKMMDKYDLSIMSACNVLTVDDKIFTLALVGNETEASGGNLWEISVFFESEPELSDFLRSAELFGSYIRRINCIPSSHSQGSYVYHICLDISNSYINALEYFIRARFPQYSSYGRYSLINAGAGEA